MVFEFLSAVIINVMILKVHLNVMNIKSFCKPKYLAEKNDYMLKVNRLGILIYPNAKT